MDDRLWSEFRFQPTAQKRVAVHGSEDDRIWFFGDPLRRSPSGRSLRLLVSLLWVHICLGCFGGTDGGKERGRCPRGYRYPPAERHSLVSDARSLGCDVDDRVFRGGELLRCVSLKT